MPYFTLILSLQLLLRIGITWGLSDRYTWLKKFRPRSDGAKVRPLPLDDNLNPKLAWEALANALNSSL